MSAPWPLNDPRYQADFLRKVTTDERSRRGEPIYRFPEAESEALWWTNYYDGIGGGAKHRWTAKADCAIYAISAATGLRYLEAQRRLLQIYRHPEWGCEKLYCCSGVHGRNHGFCVGIIDACLKELGWQERFLDKPLVMVPRMIARIGDPNDADHGHILAVNNGIVCDRVPPTLYRGWPITNYWTHPGEGKFICQI
jgi:hypothetical protein